MIPQSQLLARGSLPPNQPERGLVYDGLAQDAGGVCHDALTLSDGSCTHGPDPAPPGFDIHIAVPAPAGARQAQDAAATCDGNGVSGPRVQVIYARASDKPDGYAQNSASIRIWAAEMDAMFLGSAQETGGAVRVRFVTDSACATVVANVVLPANGDDNIDQSIRALVLQGYNRADRKYLMFVDANVYCGIAQVGFDDSPGAANQHNIGPMYARVDAGCWSGRVAAHELMHTLGAVQDSAPHTTNGKSGSFGGHCVDEYDIMCYSDAGQNQPPMTYLCPSAHEDRFDCNHDDYFHTNPPTGNYLATHWNTARNAFLIQGAGNAGVPTAVVTSTPLALPTPSVTPLPTRTPGPSPTTNPAFNRRVYAPLLRR